MSGQESSRWSAGSQRRLTSKEWRRCFGRPRLRRSRQSPSSRIGWRQGRSERTRVRLRRRVHGPSQRCLTVLPGRSLVVRRHGSGMFQRRGLRRSGHILQCGQRLIQAGPSTIRLVAAVIVLALRSQRNDLSTNSLRLTRI